MKLNFYLEMQRMDKPEWGWRKCHLQTTMTIMGIVQIHLIEGGETFTVPYDNFWRYRKISLDPLVDAIAKVREKRKVARVKNGESKRRR